MAINAVIDHLEAVHIDPAEVSTGTILRCAQRVLWQAITHEDIQEGEALPLYLQIEDGLELAG